MKLVQAFRGISALRLALVGAGGKTTAMFQLARELPGPVLITTTTHLSVEQAELSDFQSIATAPGDLQNLPLDSGHHVILVSGPATADHRLGSPGTETLQALRQLADDHHLALLVEADGSKCRPLKAPAGHEPAIPTWVNAVLVVNGLSGLGKPLDETTVHRPERFAELTGSVIGEHITAQMLRDYLLHPRGGLKDIPAAARRLVLLNQADSEDLQSQAGWIAGQIGAEYAGCLIAALQNPLENELLAAWEPLAGVILAAGGASRYGHPKALLDWHGRPFIRKVVQTALTSGLDPVIVVVGANADEIIPALDGLPVKIVYNPDWQNGQSGSVRCGVSALPAESGGAVFLLADQPHIPVELIRALVEKHHTSLSPWLAPMVEDRRANPVLFDRVTFPALQTLSGDTGGRAVMRQFPAAYLPWHDSRILLDVDTPEDYRRLLEEV